MGRISELICLGPKQKYFCKRGWTSHFGKHEVICPSGKISRRIRHREEPTGPAFGGPDDKLRDEAIHLRRHGLLRVACHRARIRATRWLGMAENPPLIPARQQLDKTPVPGWADQDFVDADARWHAGD